ncbi:ABC transporter substrate-binding protein [Microbacterium deminutum]|uniref:ABC transporter substrate-binding protein n=1 Tax=Microbacterium deminutum TaxID=344164 RepID=A0ABN2RAS6_9MICO
MRSIRKPAITVIAASAALATLAGCSAGSGGAAPTDKYVDGGDFVLALSADPGSLDPQMSAGGALFAVSKFAYDNLVSVDDKGEIGSQLAKDWKVDGTTVTMTLNDGITCSDGTDFTAQTAADNITWVADPANKSPFLGAYLPAGATAAASGSTLTVTLATPAPFVLQGLANLPMVCDAGLKDRSSLASATNGTGPYVLDKATPNDSYTYSVNKKYAWGPNGATTEEKGLPATVTARIVTNETTAANLLLSGDVNAATIIGPDRDRIEAANLFETKTPAVIGEQWFNQAKGHPAFDPAVRLALTQALDLAQLQKVITSDKGEAATALAVLPPSGCTYDAVKGSVPATDLNGAKAALDDAGWVAGADGIRAKDGKPLAVSFQYANALGAAGAAAAELATNAWKELGVQVDAKQQDDTTLAGTLFSGGPWDIAWIPVNVSSPDQLVGFLSGAAAPNGANFASIDNADYSAAVTSAMGMTGTEGCDTWKSAEAALYQAADVVPFANSVVPTFGKNAEFSVLGNIEPMSIRMLG